jgi:protein-L-isoaspartate(D-aspartate) O-methyltransferase
VPKQPLGDETVGRMQFMLDLRRRGISNQAVLRAMDEVPREHFVADHLSADAYADQALPIACGQTISQPYVVAYMTEQLDVEPHHRVLEIGTGSGYQAAVLAALAKQVYSVEIVPELAESARRVLASTGYHNVQVLTGNGYSGWPEHAPFDRIIVTAAPPEIPKALVDQLAVGGILVVPVGTSYQEIVIITRSATGVTERRTIPVRFVPMVTK